jgi:hypothetical protein
VLLGSIIINIDRIRIGVDINGFDRRGKIEKVTERYTERETVPKLSNRVCGSPGRVWRGRNGKVFRKARNSKKTGPERGTLLIEGGGLGSCLVKKSVVGNREVRYHGLFARGDGRHKEKVDGDDSDEQESVTSSSCLTELMTTSSYRQTHTNRVSHFPPKHSQDSYPGNATPSYSR